MHQVWVVACRTASGMGTVRLGWLACVWGESGVRRVGRDACGAAMGCQLTLGDMELVRGTSESGGVHPGGARKAWNWVGGTSQRGGACVMN